jgi:ATP-dependent HslUV protease ATP-binding subunit HslU
MPLFAVLVDHVRERPLVHVAEGVALEFSADGIDALADIAAEINSAIENIGARRLQTVMERVLDEVSFSATDRSGDTVTVDRPFVQKNVGDLAKNTDLSKFIL